MATIAELGTRVHTTTAGNKTLTATPTLNDLIIIVTAKTESAAVDIVAPTDNNSGGAGTYVAALASQPSHGSNNGRLQIWVRTALIASATSTIFTSTQAGSSGGGLGVFRVAGMTFTGSSAVRAAATQTSGTAATTPTPVLAGAALTANALIGAVINSTTAPILTPRGTPAYTEAFDVSYATPTLALEVMHINSGETGTSIAWGSTSATAFGSAIVELDTSAGAAATAPPPRSEYLKRPLTRR